MRVPVCFVMTLTGQGDAVWFSWACTGCEIRKTLDTRTPKHNRQWAMTLNTSLAQYGSFSLIDEWGKGQEIWHFSYPNVLWVTIYKYTNLCIEPTQMLNSYLFAIIASVWSIIEQLLFVKRPQVTLLLFLLKISQSSRSVANCRFMRDSYQNTSPLLWMGL